MRPLDEVERVASLEGDEEVIVAPEDVGICKSGIGIVNFPSAFRFIPVRFSFEENWVEEVDAFPCIPIGFVTLSLGDANGLARIESFLSTFPVFFAEVFSSFPLRRFVVDFD